MQVVVLYVSAISDLLLLLLNEELSILLLIVLLLSCIHYYIIYHTAFEVYHSSYMHRTVLRTVQE